MASGSNLGKNPGRTSIVLTDDQVRALVRGEAVEVVTPTEYLVGAALAVKEAYCIETSAEGYDPIVDDDRPVERVDYGFDGGWTAVARYRATDGDVELCYETVPKRGCRRCEDGEPHAHWIPAHCMPPKWSRLGVVVQQSLRVGDEWRTILVKAHRGRL